MRKRTIIIPVMVLAVVAAAAFAWISLRPDRCERLFERYSAYKNVEAANTRRIEASKAGCDTSDWVPRRCEELRIEYRDALSDYNSDPTNARALRTLQDGEKRARELRCAWLRAFQEFLTERL